MQNFIPENVPSLADLLPLEMMTPAPDSGPKFNGSDYLSLAATEKADQIQQAINADTISAHWMSTFEAGGLLFEGMGETFNTEGDEMSYSSWWGYRKKFIHTVGAVGKVSFESTDDHPFTGIFEGATEGFIRCSLAKQPTVGKANTAPGIGLKFLRDGMDSANLVAMYAVDGQESWNFFKNDFSNHIGKAGAALLPVAAKFATFTRWVQEVGLSDMAQYRQDGTETTPVFPFSLRFHPAAGLSTPDPSDLDQLFGSLMAIPVGSTLYEVFAMDKPTELGGKEAKIGELKLTSEMTTSKWGDQRFFVRHQDMKDDLKLRPEWEKYTAGFPWLAEGEQTLHGHSQEEGGCPFAKMFLQ